jgi:very-short-patch-repair endonuclease
MRSSILTQKRAKALRRALTQPEQRLWALLRRNGLGVHFRRQHALGPYILDFYCASAGLCVEVDGPSHEDRADADVRRTQWLAGQGITVIRFAVEEIEKRPAAVVAAIERVAAPSTGFAGPPPPLRGRG